MNPLMHVPGHDLFLPNIVRAENCFLFDSAGNRYVDLESGVWCTPIGHGHPRILRVLTEQAAKIGHAGFNYSNAIVEEAAHEILALLGFDGGKCVFLCSGSEAVEYGVRVARSIASRPLMMTMADSYFGAYGSASARREDEWFCFDWLDSASKADSGAIPFEGIGGFLFEPGSSSGLVRFPPEDMVHDVAHRIQSADGVVLVNEVTTGFGRTGTWFGYQHYGLTPDIVSMGKGIGNGYPVSVAALSPGVIDRLGGAPVKWAQSHQNDPLGAAIALEVVRVMREEGLVERGREMGNLLVTGLREIQAQSPRVRDVRARGLMLAVDLIDDPSATFTTRLQRELLERGYLVARRPGLSVLRLDPALTIERENVEGFLDALSQILG